MPEDMLSHFQKLFIAIFALTTSLVLSRPLTAAVKAIYVNGVYMGCSFEGGSHLRGGTETDLTYSPARVNSYLCITFYGGEPVDRQVARGWAWAFSGGGFVDGLQNPHFAFQQIDSPVALRQYRIVENKSANDSFTPGIALMAHVVRTGPTAHLLDWTPLSAGIGVAAGSGVRFIMGTSIQAGGRFIATAGLSVGRVDRLPGALTVGSITTDPNALFDLPQRYKRSWAVSLSYRFGDNDQAAIAAGPIIGRGSQGDPCAATAATAVAQIANHITALQTLREFKRNVLAGTPEGQELIKLYYYHTARVLYLFTRDKTLLASAGEFITAILPFTRAMVEGKGDTAALTTRAIKPAVNFAAALIVADEHYGKTRLSTDIELKLHQLSPETLDGVSPVAALRRLSPSKTDIKAGA
jgi:hypothetical protein